MMLFLVPAGRGRFELYAEPSEETGQEGPEPSGFFRRWAQRAGVRWRALVDAARHGSNDGWLRRMRDAFVCHLADSIAEGRTLWALKDATRAVARVPSTLSGEQARPVLTSLLDRSRRHHLQWFLIDLVLFVASGPFAFVPGPNVLAYYLAFRLVGHLQSWRGARRGMELVQWTLEPDAGLAELQLLVDVPRETRAPRVAAIAAELNLPRLSAFFDRVAMPPA